MTEIDYLKAKLEDKEKAFDKLYGRYLQLLKEQGELEKENEQLQKELEKFKKWEKHIGDVRREDLDRVFKMSIYEIAEAFGYYKERIRVLEEELEE